MMMMMMIVAGPAPGVSNTSQLSDMPRMILESLI